MHAFKYLWNSYYGWIQNLIKQHCDLQLLSSLPVGIVSGLCPMVITDPLSN